jgi:hypothetical protein
MEQLLALQGAPSSYMEWSLHNTLKCYKVPNRKPKPLKCLHEEKWICDVDDLLFKFVASELGVNACFSLS